MFRKKKQKYFISCVHKRLFHLLFLPRASMVANPPPTAALAICRWFYWFPGTASASIDPPTHIHRTQGALHVTRATTMDQPPSPPRAAKLAEPWISISRAHAECCAFSVCFPRNQSSPEKRAPESPTGKLSFLMYEQGCLPVIGFSAPPPDCLYSTL